LRKSFLSEKYILPRNGNSRIYPKMKPLFIDSGLRSINSLFFNDRSENLTLKLILLVLRRLDELETDLK